ncbi:MAG: helix-turn-helix domain-containing protein [Sarcina sp.]
MLGNKIKELRKQAGLTQKELCEILNIAQSTLGTIETNKQGTSRKTLKKFADYFSVSIDYLLSDDQPPSSSNIENINLKELKLIKEFKKLNEKGKDEAIKRIKELSELPKYNNIEIAEEITPLAAHEKDGKFTKEDYKHDINIMKNDDLWK